MSPVNPSRGESPLGGSVGSVSPGLTTTPKNVAFELLFLESPQYRARLPMRVQIYPHDTTDSIVTTVKNFYGLYSGPTGSKGVSFEDEHGNTLIARYENFRNNMVVYVRVIEEPPVTSGPIGQQSTFHRAPNDNTAESYYEQDGSPTQQHQQQQQQQHRCAQEEMVRPSSRSSRRRSPSPINGHGRRTDAASTSEKHGRSQSTRDHRRSMNHAHADACTDSLNGYSSGDGAASSASAKAKEHLGTTDISVENIVEGGRRKRAKFESSELPLFAPPQMPAATSNPSVSPARRIEHHHRPSLPFVHPGQHPFTNPRPMPSPQNYNNGQPAVYATPVHGHRSRDSIGYASNGSGVGSGLSSGVLPTPDPTVGSCMSEEDKDVAIQLMRLGEMSNISHGRTSASTQDDTFSGRADAASSTGVTSDGDSYSEDEMSASRRQKKLDTTGTARLIYPSTETPFLPSTETMDASSDEAEFEDGKLASHSGPVHKTGSAKAKSTSTKPKAVSSTSVSKSAAQQKASKGARPSGVAKNKKPPALASGGASAAAANAAGTTTANTTTTSAILGPMSPASTNHSRKPSVASTGHIPQPGEEEQPDLSTKPRCQRCRKSKKGCDRQRPCGRCRDAGLSADQCISEDEGNGRKGRYGRHMGVPIKKDEVTAPSQPALLPAASITTAAMTAADKNKKRKR
ncbi:hypothetical protein E4U55_004541 [Claviceps digitariae]|nr:hypothetical protein E4U55_004541 [Claviceps digitariae]